MRHLTEVPVELELLAGRQVIISQLSSRYPDDSPLTCTIFKVVP